MYQIIMYCTKSFFSVIIICIDHNKRSSQYIFCRQYCLTCTPWFCTSLRQNPRNIINVLKSIIYSYCIFSADSLDPIPDNLFKFLLNILTDDKNHLVESGLDCVMDRVIHDNVILLINRLQLFDTAAKSGTNTCCHDK